jgi:hypothetical protein
VSGQFPPVTTHPDQVEVLLSVIGSVAEPRTAIYVSTPVTTGRRAIEWHSANGGVLDRNDDSFRIEVVERNRRDAADFVRRLREKAGRVVIDPAALPDVPGWEQADYRFFWGRVIERYAVLVLFRDGWQYSSGCAYEFLVAHRAGLDVRDERENELPRNRGRRMIEAAASDAPPERSADAFLQRVARELAEEKAEWT